MATDVYTLYRELYKAVNNSGLTDYSDVILKAKNILALYPDSPQLFSDASLITTFANATLPPLPLSFWETGGYWFDLASSVVSSTTSARSLVPVAAPPVVTPSMGGNASRQLDGSTQYYTCHSLAASFTPTTPFTIAVRFRSTASPVQVVWSASYNFTAASIQGRWDGGVAKMVTQDGLGAVVEHASTLPLQWDDHVIVWTYDGVNTTKIYVDGALTTTSNPTTPIPVTSPASLFNFCLATWLVVTPNSSLGGFVKRFAVSFSRAAASSEVAALTTAWFADDYTLRLGGGPKILWVGDSITQADAGQHAAGLRYLLEQSVIDNRQSLYSIGQYNAGSMPNNRHGSLGGSDLSVIQGNFATALGGQAVKLVLLMGGTNNIAGGAAPALTAYASCLDAIWAQASALDPTVRIAVTTITDTQIGTGGQLNIAAFNAALPALWTSRSYAANLIRWDAYAAMGPWNAANYVDAVHPNPTGYSLLWNGGSNSLYPAIQAYLASISPT